MPTRERAPPRDAAEPVSRCRATSGAPGWWRSPQRRCLKKGWVAAAGGPPEASNGRKGWVGVGVDPARTLCESRRSLASMLLTRRDGRGGRDGRWRLGCSHVAMVV